MRNIGSLLIVGALAGTMTLGAYKLFFENQKFAIVSDQAKNQTFATNYTPTPKRDSAINNVDFTLAAQNTVNAVVHVKNMTISSGSPSIMDLFYGQGQSQRAQIGSGSGVIISSDGHIVTNNHVIAKASKLQVTLNNNKTYEAELIGSDANTDIALLKIDADEQLPYLAFGDSDNTKIGEWVLAVGNPFNLTSTVTAGIVSAKARNLGKRQSFIQTDAAVNPGNSGGALVNTNGDLIGINTAISSQTGSYVGYSFAVPSNIAQKVVNDLLEYGNVKNGILGIQQVPKNSEIGIEKGLNEIEGVYVGTIVSDSGAENAGIKVGDIIKNVDNIKVKNFPDLTGYLSAKRPGDIVEVTVDRDGDKLVLPVTLKENKEEIVSVMGYDVKDISPAVKEKIGIKEGVLIVGVPQGFERYGLLNKIILEIDGQKVYDTDDAEKLFGKISKNQDYSITLINKYGERERLIFQ